MTLSWSPLKQTPLHCACSHGAAGVANFLWSQKTSQRITRNDIFGFTPLAYARKHKEAGHKHFNDLIAALAKKT